MNVPLGDGGKPIEYGDPSYIYDGIYNPIVWVGKEPYRPRVETLVIRDKNKVFLRMYDKLKNGMWYTLPGGSVDADSTKEEQARNETNEEALVDVKNLYYTGIQYYARYVPGFVRSGGRSPIEYAGTINDVFVADYSKPYDKSKVEPKDLDPDIAENGKFWRIEDVLPKLLPEHIRALHESPLVDGSTKTHIGIFVANNYPKPIHESMNPDFPAVPPPDDFIYHGSKYRFDVFHPMSVDFGNAQQKPGWSTFCFAEPVLALRFGLMRTIQDAISGKGLEKCQWNFKLNKPYIYTHQRNIIRSKVLGLKFYVYHIRTDGLDIGIGNDIRFPEYTFREDNVRPYMVQTYTIDDPLLNAHLKCMDMITAGFYEDEELPKFDFYKKRHHAGFINHDYENDPKIQKVLQAIQDKELQPGDDIQKFMLDHDLVPDDLDWKPATEAVGITLKEKEFTKELLDKYKKKYPHTMLRHARTPDKDNRGRILTGGSDRLVGYVMVDTRRHMITGLEVEQGYQHLGFGKKLLDIAVKDLDAKYLTVNKKNGPAISLYKKHGWKVYKETDTMFFMSAPGVTNTMEGYQTHPSITSAMVPVIETRLTAADRKPLSSKDFGIPEEKKYPMPDKAHVLQAIRYFNKVEPKYEKILAKNIIRKLHEFDMMDDVHVSKENRFYNYAPKSMISMESSMEMDPRVSAMVGFIMNTRTTYTYGYKLPSGIILDRNKDRQIFIKHYRTLSLKEFERQKCGICFEFNYYCYDKLMKGIGGFKYRPECYYIETDYPDGYRACHTFMIVEIGKNYYWADCTWESKLTLIAFSSKQKLMDEIIKGWDGAHDVKHHILKQYTPNAGLVGLSFYEFMNKVGGYHPTIAPVEETSYRRGDDIYCSEPVEESANKDDPLIFYNMEAFETGRTNILLITGLSGSGKTTLSKKYAKLYHAEVIELDNFVRTFPRNVHPVIKQYFKENPDINVTLRTGHYSSEDYPKMFVRFFDYVIDYCKRNPQRKFIIEGIQIYHMYHAFPSDLSDYGIVVVNNSVLRSYLQRLKRGLGLYSIGDWLREFEIFNDEIYFYKQDYDKIQSLILNLYEIDMENDLNLVAPITEQIQTPLYFYHLVPKDHRGDKLVTLGYLYDTKQYNLFDRYADKYRNRICNKWKYYDKKPSELTREEIVDALKRFRKVDTLYQSYFFRYIPSKSLGSRMADILSNKDIYRIDINDRTVQRYIEDIDWGYRGSNSDNETLNRHYYETITEEEYFKDYDDSATMNFAAINHISVTFKNGYIPFKLLDRMDDSGVVIESFIDIDEIPLGDGEPSHGVPEDKSNDEITPEYKGYVVNRYKHTGEYLGLLDWEDSIGEYIKKKKYGMGLYYAYGNNTGYPEFIGNVVVYPDKTWKLVNGNEAFALESSMITDVTEGLGYDGVFNRYKKPPHWSTKRRRIELLHDIVKELGTWDYGYVMKTKRFLITNSIAVTDVENDPYFVDNYRTLSVADFERYKCGTCFDYVNYIYYLICQIFKTNKDYDIICYYIEGEDGGDHPCHVFPIVKVKSTGYCYYMETAWKPRIGLYEYRKGYNNALKTIVHEWVKGSHLSDYVHLCEYVPRAELVGVDCFTFMRIVNRNTNIEL